jgi:hypothetical protein
MATGPIVQAQLYHVTPASHDACIGHNGVPVLTRAPSTKLKGAFHTNTRHPNINFTTITASIMVALVGVNQQPKNHAHLLPTSGLELHGLFSDDSLLFA